MNALGAALTCVVVISMAVGQARFSSEYPAPPNEWDGPGLSLSRQYLRTSTLGRCPSADVFITVRNTGPRVVKSIGYEVFLYYSKGSSAAGAMALDADKFELSVGDLDLIPGWETNFRERFECIRPNPVRFVVRVSRVDYAAGSFWVRPDELVLEIESRVPGAPAVKLANPTADESKPSHSYFRRGQEERCIVKVAINHHGNVVNADFQDGCWAASAETLIPSPTLGELLAALAARKGDSALRSIAPKRVHPLLEAARSSKFKRTGPIRQGIVTGQIVYKYAYKQTVPDPFLLRPSPPLPVA